MTVSEERKDGIAWNNYKFWKAESYFNNFLVGVVINEFALLGLDTLKSAVSQK